MLGLKGSQRENIYTSSISSLESMEIETSANLKRARDAADSSESLNLKKPAYIGKSNENKSNGEDSLKTSSIPEYVSNHSSLIKMALK